MSVVRFPCWSWDSARCSEVSKLALLFGRTPRIDGDRRLVFLDTRKPYYFGNAQILPFKRRA